MRKIVGFIIVLISIGCKAQTYYCPISSTNGVAKKIDQWFIVQDSSVIIKTSANGKMDSLHFKKINSTNPAVVYFKDESVTSSLTIVHSSGSMKGTKYTDVVSLKNDLRSKGPIGLCYCTISGHNP